MISLAFSPILLKIFSGRERGDSGGGVGGPDSPQPTSQAKIVKNASVPSCARMLPPYMVQGSKQHHYVETPTYGVIRTHSPNISSAIWNHCNNATLSQKQHFIICSENAQERQIWPNTPNAVFGLCIWASQIWLSGVSLKRSCKMQFRCVHLVSIGPPVKSYNQVSLQLQCKTSKWRPKPIYSTL